MLVAHAFQKHLETTLTADVCSIDGSSRPFWSCEWDAEEVGSTNVRGKMHGWNAYIFKCKSQFRCRFLWYVWYVEFHLKVPFLVNEMVAFVLYDLLWALCGMFWMSPWQRLLCTICTLLALPKAEAWDISWNYLTGHYMMYDTVFSPIWEQWKVNITGPLLEVW